MFENVDRLATDGQQNKAFQIGIPIAHPLAFSLDELKIPESFFKLQSRHYIITKSMSEFQGTQVLNYVIQSYDSFLLSII